MKSLIEPMYFLLIASFAPGVSLKTVQDENMAKLERNIKIFCKNIADQIRHVPLRERERIIDANRAGREWLEEAEASAVAGPIAGPSPQMPSLRHTWSGQRRPDDVDGVQDDDDDDDDGWSPAEPSAGDYWSAAGDERTAAGPSSLLQGCDCDRPVPSLAHGVASPGARPTGNPAPAVGPSLDDQELPAAFVGGGGLVVDPKSCDGWTPGPPSLRDDLMVAVAAAHAARYNPLRR